MVLSVKMRYLLWWCFVDQGKECGEQQKCLLSLMASFLGSWLTFAHVVAVVVCGCEGGECWGLLFAMWVRECVLRVSGYWG